MAVYNPGNDYTHLINKASNPASVIGIMLLPFKCILKFGNYMNIQAKEESSSKVGVYQIMEIFTPTPTLQGQSSSQKNRVVS